MTDQVTSDTFWNGLDGVQAGMLGVKGNRPIPMSHYVDREKNALWFITAKGTDLVRALEAGPEPARYTVASQKGDLYAVADGTAKIIHDQGKLEELWNAVAGAWFEDGAKDDDAALVRMDLVEAEVWATNGSLRFLYEIARAHLTDAKPDMGAHGTIRFAA